MKSAVILTVGTWRFTEGYFRSYFLSTVLCFIFFTRGFSQAGSLDGTFGNEGRTYTNMLNLNIGTEQATAMVVQADGKILVAGSCGLANLPSLIFRFNSDGSFDQSFGIGGKAVCFGMNASSMAIQNDGKIVLGGSFSSPALFALARLNADGSLDNGFGTNGKVYTAINGTTNSCYINSIAIQNDARIVAAGYCSNESGSTNFALARYNMDGSPDNSFDSDGKLTTVISNSSQINSIALQGDGKIVGGGWAITTGNFDFAVVRYNLDGSRDNTFGVNGIVTTSMGTNEDKINSIAIQTDGKIVAGGNVFNSGYFFAAARYNTDGSLDNSFDADGKLTTTVGITTFQRAMAIQSDAKILLGGSSLIADNLDYTIVRYNTDGSLDNSFDTDGKLTMPIGSADDRINALAIQNDGKIAAAGISVGVSGSSFYYDFSMSRINSNGSIDNSFDTDGKLIIPNYASVDAASAMAIQSDGKIIVAGNANNGSNLDFALVRYNTDGSLDNSFDGDGKLTTTIGTGNDQVNAIAIQADGKIVAAGYSLNSTGKPVFALTRYNTNGSLDNTFDGDGKLTTAIGTVDDMATSIAIQSDGKIVVAGGTYNGGGYSFAVVRYNTDGSLDNSFDGDGKLLGTGVDIIKAITIQNDGKIIAACGGYYYFTVLRFNTDGSPDNSFDGDGKAITQIGIYGEQASAIAIQDDGKIVVAGYSVSSTFIQEFAIIRFNTDGSVDNSFDVDGKVTTTMSLNGATANSIAIQNNGKILISGYSNFSSIGDFALARYNTDGSLDNSFDGDGKIILDLFGGSGEISTAMKLNLNRIYLTGNINTEGRQDIVLATLLNDLSSLPLHLLDFTGVLRGNDAVLNWKTESEINTSRFEIEHSNNGFNFSTIGVVAALNNPGVQSYDFTHASISSGVHYYRLKMVDIDGQFTYSKTVKIVGGLSKANYIITPNPANSFITVKGKNLRHIILSDINGRRLQSTVASGADRNTLYIKDKPTGIYLISLVDFYGNCETQKIFISQ